jgi:hypothetical protein
MGEIVSMRRLLIVNLVLIAVVAALAVRFHNDWVTFEGGHQPGAIQPQPESLPKTAGSPAAPASAPIDWTEIPTRNPFSFDRTDIAVVEAAPPPKPSGPKPILFGTMTLGSNQMAMVAPSQPAGNRNYRPMKVGETIDGWTITKIMDKSIVISSNSVEETVLMNDPTAQVQRDSARTSAPVPASVISVGQSAPPPATASSPSIFQPPTTAQPSSAPKQRRRVTQLTPFGIREIEVEE